MRLIRAAVVGLTIALVGLSAAPASAVVAHAESPSTSTPAAVTPDWLQELNTFRHASGLGTVTENTSWKDGLLKHLNYLNKTPSDLRTGEYASWHAENPASPYYTPEGALAGGTSNLMGGGGAYGAWHDIDAWLTGPYHAFPMLLPQLVQAEYARDGYYAGLSLGQGFDYTIQNPPGPVLFPGPGITMPMSYVGIEDPDPLLPCGWEYPDAIPGIPLSVLTTVEPTDGTTATITADDGPDYSSAAGTICLLDTDKKLNPATVRPADSGGYYQLILIPKTMLTASRYHVTVNMPGQAPITWSFIVDHSDDYNNTIMQRLVLHVSDGATTVMGNLTVTNPLFAGFTTAYPCLEGRPTASNNNFVANQTIPNFVAVHPDANGDICIYSSQLTDLIWDQVAETSAFTVHNAVRKLDTRTGGKPAAGSTTKVHVTDSGAQTVLGNLTVTAPNGNGFTTVYPCLDGRPNASNNNYVRNQTIPNFVAAHPDAAGDICIYTSAGAQLIWDQVGETDAFASHTAQRLLDTRTGAKPAAGSTTKVHVTDAGAATVLGNLTVTAPTAGGFTTVYPCLDGRPNASNNNYVKNQTIPNFVAAHPDSNGDICIYTSASAQLLWDQVAETTSFTAHNANRIWDTRTPRAYD